MRRVLHLVGMLMLTNACATIETAKIKSPVIEMSIDKSTPLAQTKAGVTMTLVQPNVEIGKFVNKRIEDAGASSLMNSVTGSDSGKIFKVVDQPVYFPNSRSIGFKVKVRNNTERPLRLAGAIIAVDVSEKLLSPVQSDLVEPHSLKGQTDHYGKLTTTEPLEWMGISEEKAAELNRIIILPGKEKDIEIGGPRHLLIPGSATFALRFYDVATKYDAASNPIVKENFEWMIHYKRSQKELTETVNSTTRMVNPFELASIKALNEIM